MSIQTSTPAEQGVDAAGVLAFLDAFERLDDVQPHGLVIQRHGRRIAEGYWSPYSPDRMRLVYSLSKTFTVTALAMQLGEGRLGLDDLVADHLPDLMQDAAPITRRMRIRHLASMATGHDHDMIDEANDADPAEPLRGFFAIAPPSEPGSRFAYNQPATIALAVVLQRLAAQNLTTYLRPRLVDPTGMSGLAWREYAPGFDLGYSGAYTTLDSIARLGQLYLGDGVWDGRRLLPEGWVAQAASVQVANPEIPETDWHQGYGFQLWMSRHGYRGDGAFGQFMLVLPAQDTVVAIFSGTHRMQAVLDEVWTHLLPALRDAPLVGAKPADAELAQRLQRLTMPTAAVRTGWTAVDEQTLPTDARFHDTDRSRERRPSLSAVQFDGDAVVLVEDGVSAAPADQCRLAGGRRRPDGAQRRPRG